MNPIDKAIASNVKQHFQMYAERSVEGTCGKCCPFVYACDRIDRKTYDDPRLCEIIVGDNLFPRPVPQEDPRQLRLF